MADPWFWLFVGTVTIVVLGAAVVFFVRLIAFLRWDADSDARLRRHLEDFAHQDTDAEARLRERLRHFWRRSA